MLGGQGHLEAVGSRRGTSSRPEDECHNEPPLLVVSNRWQVRNSPHCTSMMSLLSYSRDFSVPTTLVYESKVLNFAVTVVKQSLASTQPHSFTRMCVRALSLGT
jgi:hypothetical protein